jgi:phospholipase C
MIPGRRDFLRGIAGVSGAALLSRLAGRDKARAEAPSALPSPEDSGIAHVVVVMMENRSFDHFLGWLPNADGRQAGLTYVNGDGVAEDTHPLVPDYTGCSHPGPDHSYAGGRLQYDGGAMDGFLRSGRNDEYAIGYYEESDLPFLAALARSYTTLDRNFCSFLGPTFPNRIFLHAAQTDRIGDTIERATVPTIWDRLADAGVSGRYYFSNVPFLALWGGRYRSITRSYSGFLLDALTGHLPAVSFVEPRFTITDNGTGNDDHPHADIRRGDAFLARTFSAIALGPAWPHTVFVVTRDEWGGFFDHVAPPRAAAPNRVDGDLVDGKALLGFRVPAVVVSPWSRGDADNPRVSSAVFDHTSILKLIEWRWSLEPLTARDGSADIENLAVTLDFANPDLEVPDLPSPLPPPPVPCRAEAIRRTGWSELLAAGRLDGWSLGRD